MDKVLHDFKDNFMDFIDRAVFIISPEQNKYWQLQNTRNDCQMEDFKRILMRKAKIIGELKYPQRKNRESILKYLKQIKKQEKQSEQNDLQVLKSLASFQYEQKQFLEKAYFLSFTVMKALCKRFEFFPEEKETFDNVVEMHYKFYTKEGALQKSQQIRMTFRKKTFSKQTFLNNLLVSLYHWGKNKLDKFLSKHISSIEKDLLNDLLQSPKKIVQPTQKLQNTSPLKQSMFEGTLMNISYSQKLWKYERPSKKQDLKALINGNDHLLEEQNESFDIGPFLSNQITEEAQPFIQHTSQRIQTSFEPQRSIQLAPGNYLLKQRSKSYNRDYGEKNFTLQNLNKQIFYGTYWKQMNQLYKNLNILDDLDSYYLKTFKKQKEERKEELAKNRMDEIVEFMIKNMPKIKKSIQTYDNDYSKYCPSDIKQFHTVSSKILQEENKKKAIKNTCLKKIEKTQTQEKHKVIENLKSEENNLSIQSPQKLNRKSVLIRSRQRNKSLNDAVLRKSTQQKAQMQVKLPIVYNPEHLHSMAESQTQKALAIHQKYEKFLVNGARPNKGLVRYKQMTKERQKNTNDGSKFMDDKIGAQQNPQIENHRQHEYEVANIRKILRQRQKERIFVNKTPTCETNKEDELMKNIMIHIKAMDTKYTNGFTPTKVDKFDVFLSNFKSGQSIPFALKINSRSINLKPNKSHQLEIRSEFKVSKEDLLPKI